MSDLTPRVRLGVFAALLVMVFGVAYGIGAAGEPVDHRSPVEESPMESDHDEHG